MGATDKRKSVTLGVKMLMEIALRIANDRKRVVPAVTDTTLRKNVLN